MSLSREAAGRVARALSAYIRDTPARELPGELKRFRSLRPQTVGARASEVISALDDEVRRGLVLEWLDDRPRLPKSEVEVLRLAAERPEGWEQRIEDLTPKPAAHTADAGELAALRERVERERAKAADARDEARKVKEEARRAVQGEQRRVTALERDLIATTEEVQRARAGAKEIEARAAADVEARDRAVRRERRDAQRARRERDDLKEQLRMARKEATRLRKTIRDLEKRLESARSKPQTRKQRPEDAPDKRLPLRPPPGLFEDAPETLAAWLQTPNVHVLIDGYNVTKAEEGFGDLHLPEQRDRLIEEVARLGLRYDLVPTIVFDGSDVLPGTRRRKKLPVRVEYSKPDEIADDHLVARLRALPNDPVIVVTNDRELQDRARAEGATVATSNQFLALVR